MSRCLPFSPEAFSNRRSSHEALIKKEKEERKLLKRREEELKKKLRKNHNDKAEKRHKYVSNVMVTRPRGKEYNPQTGIKVDQYSSKLIVDESENSEKSEITEENEPPTYSGSVCNMSDNSENTNKRKRQDDDSVNEVKPRKKYRIRLVSKKPSTPDSSLIEQGESSAPKQPESCSQERTGTNFSHANTNTNLKVEQPSTKPCLDLPLSAPERTKISDTKKAESHVKHSRRSTSSTYEMLIEDWVPPSLQELEAELKDDDEDWLFGSRKPQRKTECESLEASHDKESCARSSPTWPKAKYLSDVGIYALPYTVPF